MKIIIDLDYLPKTDFEIGQNSQMADKHSPLQ